MDFKSHCVFTKGGSFLEFSMKDFELLNNKLKSSLSPENLMKLEYIKTMPSTASWKWNIKILLF